ncbi:MAG: thioredoxin domain-containing protein [Deltaproteobacteria bacterium]|nr:thioredoxin domain-containing protein [Deltaproteobacteria bacterium]
MTTPRRKKWVRFLTLPKDQLPGAEKYPFQLIKQFEDMATRRGDAYRPRAEHVRPDGYPEYTNRLFLESSPYLLQHAHNPVNWYPWGDEAFNRAAKKNLPVFASIGYSTCHWCHVMEKESFEDTEIAEYLNRHFIAIKVDREERPDIDAVYMNAVVAMTGRGGWPLSVWLTPDKKPIYGGTYFQARAGDRPFGAGFLDMLKSINDIYHNRRKDVLAQALKITQAVEKMSSPGEKGDSIDTSLLKTAVIYYKQAFDPVYGGVKGEPKFPGTLPVDVLFRHYKRTGDNRAKQMAETTLEKMENGGIHDQVGGGFHRYSTDEKWLVPHFEKMLYDNALLAADYVEGYQVTKREDFKQTAEDILEFIKREMTSGSGGFYSAMDADSTGPDGRQEEGYFYTWTKKEINDALGEKQAKPVIDYFGVTDTGNFEGRNILWIPNRRPADFDLPEAEINTAVREAKKALYKKREKRHRPLTDKKIITAWNGLMISAYARAGLVFSNPDHTRAAQIAARFILSNLHIKNRLYRSFTEGRASRPGFLADYAYFTASLLDLYKTDHDLFWLTSAIELDRELETNYEDKKNGGFYMTAEDQEKLITREKPLHNGALPSANFVCVSNLLRLYHITEKDQYLKRAQNGFASFASAVSRRLPAPAKMLEALDLYTDTSKEIIIVIPAKSSDYKNPFMPVISSTFLPNHVIVVAKEGDQAALALIPALGNRPAIDNRPTAYVCENRACLLPTTDPEVFAKQFGQ